jgi:hypothetical protein
MRGGTWLVVVVVLVVVLVVLVVLGQGPCAGRCRRL